MSCRGQTQGTSDEHSNYMAVLIIVWGALKMTSLLDGVR